MLTLIDNYDSFTYNLAHYLAELGAEPVVVRNDALSADEVIARKPRAIVMSPGPGTPDDAGIGLRLVEAAAASRTPLLGVCLGHQTIGQAFGGKVVRCHEIVHGKVSQIHHRRIDLFDGVPSPVRATRYHSLVLEPSTLPESLVITAWLEDRTIMAVRHVDLPIHGVQFHPESIASESGHRILANFLTLQ